MAPLGPETAGVEIELEYVSPTASGQFAQLLRHKLDNDGSLRHQTYNINGVPIVWSDPESVPSYFMPDDREFGVELVSDVYAVEDMRTALRNITPYLSHVPVTAASSIHFHVDVADTSWTVVQRVMRWAYHLEAVLFRLSCAGETHRGEMLYQGRNDNKPGPNDYRFTRPLSAPMGIHIAEKMPMRVGDGRDDNRALLAALRNAGGGGEVRPLINLDKLLNARSASEFVAAWGRMDLYWNIPGGERLEHYVPHRLHMVNPCAILRHGCLEWRLTDGRYAHMARMFDVILAIHRLASAGVEPTFEPMPLGREYDVDAGRVSDLLGVDVKPMWGHRWPGATVVADRLSHYGKFSVPSIEMKPVERINNMREMDKGGIDFALYRRKGR